MWEPGFDTEPDSALQAARHTAVWGRLAEVREQHYTFIYHLRADKVTTRKYLPAHSAATR